MTNALYGMHCMLLDTNEIASIGMPNGHFLYLNGQLSSIRY